MLKFNDLLFYTWSLSTISRLKDPCPIPFSINQTKLHNKLSSLKFYKFLESNLFNHNTYWSDYRSFFINFPGTSKPSSYERYLATTPKEHRFQDTDYTESIELVVLRAFNDTLKIWLYLPIILSELFKYYSFFKPIPLKFAEIEFEHIDIWIQILPVFSDFLGHLLINDTPLLEQVITGSQVMPWPLKPPIVKDINFSEHIREYYFGEGSVPEFKDVISLYLDNRLELKTKCLTSFNMDKQLNSQIPNDLAVYFISHFLIKDISKYTLRFVVANLDLSIKNPFKPDRDARVKEWNSYSEKEKKKYWPAGWLAEQKKGSDA